MMHIISQRINQALARIRQAFRILIGATDSAAAVQRIQAQGIGNENLRGIELFQQYGFTSHPLPGTMGIVLPLGGVSSHSIVIATEHGAYRLKSLNPGEVALYTDEGAKIVLKRGKLIEADCETFRVNCTGFEVNCKQAAVNCDTWATSATDSASFTTPELSTSEKLTAQGLISGNGGMSVKGGEGSRFEGNLDQTGGSFTTDGDVSTAKVSLNGHEHPHGHNGAPTGGPM
ncbi:phage baseplate assembly protein V [Salmonella enterica]|nr:phage baseplate assembly protein V [Salmonella enterica]ECD6159435.1 phage baseplate assembly protein V [Salmonella enterica subsp. enterica]ECD7354630.1 phage baseplate assembly protein V [Salmonella enterica subsp. enterica serovar Poano]EAW3063450.1 phage baseplate assembly protein V [Salmonella enterica]EBN6862755.1 phage baseplate assembly protein V [Salmonella enterica]